MKKRRKRGMASVRLEGKVSGAQQRTEWAARGRESVSDCLLKWPLGTLGMDPFIPWSFQSDPHLHYNRVTLKVLLLSLPLITDLLLSLSLSFSLSLYLSLFITLSLSLSLSLPSSLSLSLSLSSFLYLSLSLISSLSLSLFLTLTPSPSLSSLLSLPFPLSLSLCIVFPLIFQFSRTLSLFSLPLISDMILNSKQSLYCIKGRVKVRSGFRAWSWY